MFRFPKTYPGFYIGFWHKGSKMAEYDEAGAEDRLSKALGIRDMGLTPDDIEEWNV